jgi:itaconate CoA-transferase
VERVRRRDATNGKVAAAFGAMDVAALTDRLAKADIAFARVSDPEILRNHPHLRRITVATPSGPASYPAPPAQRAGEPRSYGAVPALGEHTAAVRDEFLPPIDK